MMYRLDFRIDDQEFAVYLRSKTEAQRFCRAMRNVTGVKILEQ
jgi:hypothetical protein